MSKFILFLMFSVLLTGCGDKIVKMNEYKNIQYSYHAKTSEHLEEEAMDLIEDDSKIKNRIVKSADILGKKINDSLNQIEDLQKDTTYRNNTNNQDARPNQINSNRIYKDRFDSLRLN